MPIVSVDEVSGAVFDYIVIGGGTTGLVVAARLSEDPNITVLVLDAGDENADDPLIMRPGHLGVTFLQEKYDWAFNTVPQKHAGGKTYYWPRGKSLGGSTAINFSCWTIPSKADIDDWERLGSPGWNWENYEKFSHRVANFTPPSCYPEGLDVSVMKPWDDFSGGGPLKLSYPKHIPGYVVKVSQAWLESGVPVAPAPWAGNPAGHYFVPNTLDPQSNQRSYSSNAYYTPNKGRSNLKILTSAYVRKILTEKSGDIVVAMGVEFSFGSKDSRYIARVNKDVILSAGTIKSPQILELSGIGRPGVLSAIEVPVKVPLDGVGENVQEHYFTGISWELKDDIPDLTWDVYRDEVSTAIQAELFAKGEGTHMMGVTSVAWLPLDSVTPRATELIELERTAISNAVQEGKIEPGMAEQYKLMFEKIANKSAACEFITVPGFQSSPNPPKPNKKYLTFLLATNHHFSRGSIHATSKSLYDDPAIDPHYFERDIDIKITTEMLRKAREIIQQPALKEAFGPNGPLEVNPGLEVQSDDDIANFIKQNLSTTFHTVGTLSMLPQDKGGVVDPKLKVYGTLNIRVADLSIVPLHISCHAQATAFIIGEQAAAIIKGESV